VPFCTQDEAAPFVEGAYKYVDKALQWGVQYGIGVLIELHAARGSQNGQDNSAPARQGHVGWNDKQPSPRCTGSLLAYETPTGVNHSCVTCRPSS